MSTSLDTLRPIVQAQSLILTFGRVVGLSNCNLELYPGEVLAVIGDNGAGKSTLIKCLSGAYTPDSGTIQVDGQEVHFKNSLDSRSVGIETVYQTLAVAPALDIASNMYLGREVRKAGFMGTVLRQLDHAGMRKSAKAEMTKLGIGTLQDMSQAVETLSGGQRQSVSVARAQLFGSKVIILDEPTAALGVRESNQVLKMIEGLRDRGIPVILISHNMPQVFQVSDRIHVQRLGSRAAVVTPQTHTMNDAVAIMTGAMKVDEKDQALGPVRSPAPLA
jgi:fructose transport system ATP-binding protein